jgi:hypothetical protein
LIPVKTFGMRDAVAQGDMDRATCTAAASACALDTRQRARRASMPMRVAPASAMRRARATTRAVFTLPAPVGGTITRMRRRASARPCVRNGQDAVRAPTLRTWPAVARRLGVGGCDPALRRC